MSDAYEQYYPYRVGDYDPAYDDGGDCGEPVPRDGHPGDPWICTLPDGHIGPHVAHGSGGQVLAIDPPCPDYLMVSEGL